MQLATTENRVPVTAEIQETVLLGGDLSKLTANECITYYKAVCESLGLNPLTRPFDYLILDGKKVLYARKDCTEQLRRKRTLSIVIKSRDIVNGIYVVLAQASESHPGSALMGGIGPRTDESIGAVAIEHLKGHALANAMMKAETKAKRRVTLSICGLGMLDETEVETIPGAKIVQEQPPRAPEPQPGGEVTLPLDQPSEEELEGADHITGVLIPFGDHQGKDIADPSIEDHELKELKWWFEKQVKEPKKARFKDKNEEMVLALEAEIDRRHESQ